MLIGKGLNKQELSNIEDYITHFGTNDLENIKAVLESVDDVAENYFSDKCRHHREELAAWTITKTDKDNNSQFGEYFFAIYAIGGQINKERPRKDIDLMIVTNMYYRDGSGFCQDHEEWIHESLTEHSTNKFNLEAKGKAADAYNLAQTKGKIQFKAHPLTKAMPIDIVYVRSFPQDQYKFISEKDFDKLDVDKEGNQLSKLIIYRYTKDTNLSTALYDIDTMEFLTRELKKEFSNKGYSSGFEEDLIW